MKSPIKHDLSPIFLSNHSNGWGKVATIQSLLYNLIPNEWNEIKIEYYTLSFIGLFIFILLVWLNKKKKRKNETN